MYSHHLYSSRVLYCSTIHDCQSCSWSAEQGIGFFSPVSVGARSFCLARRVRPSRPASARTFRTLKLNLVLTSEIPPAFRDGVYRSRQDQSPVCQVTQLRTDGFTAEVRWHKASSPQGSSSDECCLFRYQNGPIHQRIYFVHTCSW